MPTAPAKNAPTADPIGAAKRRAKREGWLRWIKSEADEHAIRKLGCTFDIERAERVQNFCSQFLRHGKGEFAGKPFELLDWQRDDVIFPLFGWVRPDASRRYRKAYIEIPKKNGKSALASAVGLYMLAGDGEAGAEVYACANDQKQAGIVHKEAQRMVEASPDLAEALIVHKTSHNISFPETASFYRALTAVPKSNEGWNGHCCICDELHMWQGRELWDALRYMFAARSQPLLFMITTAGDNPLSVCKEQHDYSRQLLAGKAFDDRYLPYIRAADPADDWTDPKTWTKANPSFGITLNAADFADDVNEARKTPSSVNSFKRYRLNVWTTGENPWLKSEDWDRCRRDFTAAELTGKTCWAGLDLAKTRDTTALVLAFKGEGEEVFLLPYFWLPEETAREQSGTIGYEDWAASKKIELTPGDVCDYAFIRRRVRELAKTYNIQKLLYDPYNAEETTQQIEQGVRVGAQILEAGTGIEREPFGQTITNFAGPTAEFERRVIAGKIAHDGHPVLAWQIGNAQVRTDANNNKRPVKPSPNDPRKIDGVVAAIMALSGLLEGHEEISVYETRGIRYLDELP